MIPECCPKDPSARIPSALSEFWMATLLCTRLNASDRSDESFVRNARSIPMLAIACRFEPVMALTPWIPLSNVAKLRSDISVQLAISDADSESSRMRHTSATKEGMPMI